MRETKYRVFSTGHSLSIDLEGFVSLSTYSYPHRSGNCVQVTFFDPKAEDLRAIIKACEDGLKALGAQS